MALDKKLVWISAVFLVVALAVAFNIEKFTGKATTTVILPKVYLSSDPKVPDESDCIVKAGNKIYVTIETGSKGIRRNGYIYAERGETEIRRADVEFDQNCGGGICRPNKVSWADYRVPTSWKGKYCVKVAQLGTNQLIGKCFTVQ